VYNPAEHLDRRKPRQLVLDHTQGLAAGDQVLITNALYGGGARKSFQVLAHITEVSANAIQLNVDLPEHLLRSEYGTVVYKRSAVHVIPMGEIVSQQTAIGERLATQLISNEFTIDLAVEMHHGSPRVDFRAHTFYRNSCQLFHLALAIESKLPLTEIFLKNRTVAVPNQRRMPDYWLWKEGVRAGDENGGWLVLHNPNIALTEIMGRKTAGFGWKTIPGDKRPRVVINLEHYQAQHFHRHVGTQNCSPYFSRFEDLSLPSFSEGDRTERTFSLFVGRNLGAPPRLMLAPKGRRAVHIWTEHADKTSLETQRAAYYGHQNIEHANAARGGFVGHGHVVTKSIFHDNPRNFEDGVRENGERNSIGPSVSFTGSDEFRRFLDDLFARGSEICLHSSAPDDGPPEEVKQAISELAGRYGSATWIDHDMLKIRSSLGYEGGLAGPYHMIPSWKAHGIKYFWTWASEDFAPRGASGIDLLHDHNGSYTPTPLYWRCRLGSEDLIVWGANECPLQAFTEDAIDKLIRSRGVSIHHHYYPYICDDQSSFGFIQKSHSGAYCATDRFNTVLALLASRRDQGELYIATIGEILNHWTALEDVRFDLLPPDRFVLENKGARLIQGFTYAVRAARIESEDTRFRSRPIDDGDLLVWFDLSPKRRYTFRVHPHHDQKIAGAHSALSAG
jgi:hypothetical protein